MDYAIIKLNGKQFIVNKGSLMKLDRVSSDTVVEVLMYGDDTDATFGTPVIEGFGVKFGILEDKKDKKVQIRRYKSKSRYRKEKGHRQPVSVIKVLELGKNVKTEFTKLEKEIKDVENKSVKNTKKESTSEKKVESKEVVKATSSKTASKTKVSKSTQSKSTEKPKKTVAKSKTVKKKEK